MLAEHNGLRIHEVPVDWVDDPDSRVHVASTARDDLKGIWRMLRRFAAGEGSLPAGALPDTQRRARPGRPAGALRRHRRRHHRPLRLLFVVLAGPLGPIGADVVALARLRRAQHSSPTAGSPSPGGAVRPAATSTAAGLAVAAVPLVVTVAALLALGAAGVTSIAAELVVLTVRQRRRPPPGASCCCATGCSDETPAASWPATPRSRPSPPRSA